MLNGRQKEIQFDVVCSFYDERAAVKIGNKWFHIRPDGTAAYKDRYEEVGPFHAGRARVHDNQGTFYIDKDGQAVSVILISQQNTK